MRKRFLKLTTLCLGVGISFAGISVTGLAAESTDAEDVVGTIGFAQCSEYLNVRASADIDAEIIGKLYNNGSAEILEADENGWYHIRSGNVDGYVASEFVATGAEAEEIAAATGYTTAEVGAISLNVRAEASTTSDVVGSASESEELEVVAEEGDWVKVVLSGDIYGYVSTEYVHVSTEYPTAVTLEEEAAAALAEETAEVYEEAEDSYTYEEAEWSDSSEASEETVEEEVVSESYDTYTDTAEDTTYTETADTSYTEETYTEDASYTETTYTEDTSYTETTYTEDTSYTETTYTEDTSTDSTSDSDTSADTSSSSSSTTGQAIADYACQFVGNPYVWGGTSLTDGADCSGFVLAVFANFGISLPHSAASQAGYGTEVSYSDLQAGDLVFYSDGSGISHVAIYIGGGSIVHAANSSSGICYSSVDYSTPVCCRRLV